MTIEIMVFHQKELSISLTRKCFDTCFENHPVATFNVADDELKIALERAFRTTQNIEESWAELVGDAANKEHPDFKMYGGFRSTSVGDVIAVVRGNKVELYGVDWIGFKNYSEFTKENT